MPILLLGVAGVAFGLFACWLGWRSVVEAAVLLVLRWTTPNWVPGIELVGAFGAGVYGILRRLEREGKLERRTEPGGPERGGRERAFYRWALPGGR
jgi:hypothetical protein